MPAAALGITSIKMVHQTYKIATAGNNRVLCKTRRDQGEKKVCSEALKARLRSSIPDPEAAAMLFDICKIGAYQVNCREAVQPKHQQDLNNPHTNDLKKVFLISKDNKSYPIYGILEGYPDQPYHWEHNADPMVGGVKLKIIIFRGAHHVHVMVRNHAADATLSPNWLGIPAYSHVSFSLISEAQKEVFTHGDNVEKWNPTSMDEEMHLMLPILAAAFSTEDLEEHKVMSGQLFWGALASASSELVWRYSIHQMLQCATLLAAFMVWWVIVPVPRFIGGLAFTRSNTVAKLGAGAEFILAGMLFEARRKPYLVFSTLNMTTAKVLGPTFDQWM
ncbi:hypothetical protein DFH09DRAFT_1097818 [Mycena vulgaris]|nr:hypothetical protein DFH09DRAFT_1097818 [Mycena vulgaris]